MNNVNNSAFTGCARPRHRAMAAACCIGLLSLLVACAKTEPIEFQAPSGFDKAAARELRDEGNGLWLLEGSHAVSVVLDAMDEAPSGSFTARVLERVEVETGVFVDGRVIEVVSVWRGTHFAASVQVGEQAGELVALDEALWVRGNSAFAESFGVTAGDDFVCVPRLAAKLSDYEPLTHPAEFLRTALTGVEIGTLEATGESETQTVVLGVGGAPIGELVVARHGAPVPMSLILDDPSGTVTAQFEWGAVPILVPPTADVPEGTAFASRCS